MIILARYKEGAGRNYTRFLVIVMSRITREFRVFCSG